MTNEELADRFLHYTRQMNRESDRGSVIVGAAILEDLLQQMLVARLVPAVEKDDELLEGGSAPCATFSSKIDLAYRVGVIGLTLRSSLHIVRRMRNDAAHAGEPRALTSPQLQSRLRELFRLNQDVVAGLWQAIQSVTAPPVPAAPTSPDAASAFVAKVGWRGTWDILIAMLAAGASFVPDKLVSLTPAGAQPRDVVPNEGA